MTLTEYLGSAQAIEDVRMLLRQWKSHDGTSTSHIGPTGQIMHASLAEAWTRIELATSGKDWRLPVAYYRYIEASGTFVVSDCGEAVSGIMRRTGKDWADACALISGLTGVVAQQRASISAADLPAALVSVLSAVAKCAEVG